MVKKDINLVFPGEVLGNSIYTKEGNLLLAKNTVLTASVRQKLINNQIFELVVYEKDIYPLDFKTNIDDRYRYAEKVVYQAIYENEEVLEKIIKHHYDTYLHSIRVAILSVVLGIEFVEESEWKNLALGALIHDIGKLFITNSLLNNKNVLSSSERELINTHASLGYEYLKHSGIPQESRLVCLLHHENVDGSGYPLHLKDNKIHIFSKIVKLADVFDAMVSKRGYKSKINPSDVMEYIFANVDTLFDFRLVEAFARVAKCYTVGDKVLLSNGVVATVSKIENPLRPVIMYENGVEVDLARNVLNLTIKEDMGKQHYA